jgi:hypothetical protein
MSSKPEIDERRPVGKSLRGFAHLRVHNPQRFREIASKGGVAAHARGTAHEFTPDEAVIAGRKGGATCARRREAARRQLRREGG